MKSFLIHQILILLSSAILITDNTYGQTRLENVELNTQRTIRKLISKIYSLDNKDTIIVNNVNLLSKSATILFDKIRNDENLGQPNDTLFINSLELSQQVLNQLLVDWRSNEKAANTMKAIKIDYDIKTASSPLAASSKVLTNVEVSVVTKSKNQDVSGYDVLYTYMWDSEAKEEKNFFNNQTNNAIKNLSPGYYVFWIEKNGILIQMKSKVEVGNLMEPKETLIFNL